MQNNDLFPPYATSIIGWLLLLLGLIYNNRKNNERDFRKEERAILDRILKEIEVVSSKSIEFHSKESIDFLLSEKILSEVQRLYRVIARLSFYGRASLSDEMKSLRQSVTSDNFAVSREEFKRQDSNSEILLGIVRASLILMDRLEEEYFKNYNKTIKKRKQN